MKKSLLVAAAIFATTLSGVAETNPSNSYNWSEQWSVEAQGGIDMLAAENAGKKLFPSTSGAYGIAVAKQFNPFVGARIQMLGGGDKSWNKTTGVNVDYTFHHIGVFAEASVNLSNLWRPAVVGEEQPFNFNLMVGPGFISSSGMPKDPKYALDCSSYNSIAFILGLEVSYTFTPRWEAAFEINSFWTGDNYNGVDYGLAVDGVINYLVGVRYTF